MMTRITRRIAVAALCLLAGSLSAQGSSLADALGGDGAGYEFRVGSQRDGSSGTGDMQMDDSGNIVSYITKGRTTLQSSKLNLVADFLNYDGVAGLVTCTGSVEVDQDGVKANCEKMIYTLATGEIVMTGSPRVEQDTPTSKSRFSGMAEFFLKRGEAGDIQIRMSGGEEILCEMMPAAAPGATPTPSSDSAKPKKDALSGTGFAGLGSNVIIKTRPRADAPATVLAAIDSAGVFSKFNAMGSVLVESDDLRLRSDELEFDAIRSRVEARRNVYIKQATIEADCQAMTYEIKEGRIDLSGKPDIRETRPNGVYRISDLASYIITRSPDGSIATQSIAGPDGPFTSKFIPNPGSEPAAATTPEIDEGEIRLDSDADLQSLDTAPK
jgi:lipopolysaccharide export system protein LptA